MRLTLRYWSGTLLFLICDYLALLAAELSAISIRDLFFSDSSFFYILPFNKYVGFPLIYILFCHIEQLYHRRTPFYTESEKLFYACVYGTLALIFVLYVSRFSGSTSRLFVGLFGSFAFLFMLILRYVTKRYLLKHGLFLTPVLLIGAGKTAELLIHALTHDVGLGCKIIGVLEDNKVNANLNGIRCLGKFSDAEKVIRRAHIRDVFIAAPGLSDEEQGRLIYRIQPYVKNICIIPNLVGVPVGSTEIECSFDDKMLFLRLKNNLARPLNRFVKGCFDYVLTFFGTLTISPILIAIALWIYIDNPGPVFFKHERIGRDGKTFKCLKFRTMCTDSEKRLKELLEKDPEARAEWERDFKLKHDPRITRAGRFLRRTSLDELPQIFNVLRGEMSLVGPRPIIHEELERYGQFAQDYLMVKPGITGMWQVSGRNDVEYSERVMMDCWYVRNWSVWIDLVLLLKTFSAVVLRRGAY